MKIFELQWTNQDEKEWIAADNVLQALETYFSITDTDIMDLEDNDEIVELPKSEWKNHFVREDGDKPKESFASWMKRNKKPDIIAGTMYD